MKYFRFASYFSMIFFVGDNLKTALHVARESLMVDLDEFIIEVIVTEPTTSEPPSVHYEIRTYATPKVFSYIILIK